MSALYRRAALALAVCTVNSPVAAAALLPIAPAGAAQERQALPPSGAVNSAQAQKLIRDLGGLVVLDVRTPSEFGGGHIPGALNVPVASMENRMAEIPHDKPTLIVCRAGKRAAKAYQTLSRVRPGMVGVGLWYLDATTEYRKDGTYVFVAAVSAAPHRTMRG